MAPNRSPESVGQADADPSDRLDSWKQIASYVQRDVSTVQRWERKEGLPIHRHVHDKLGSVYAFRHELEDWRRGRGDQLDRLDAEPELDAAGDSRPADEAAATAATPAASEPRHKTDSPPWRWAIVGGAAVAAVAAIAAGLGRVAPLSTPRTAIGSLAVLPLEYVSIDPAHAYLAAGLTDELTARLAALPGLRVTSRTSAAAFERRLVSLPAIARELAIDAAVEGTVRHENGRVAMSVRLVDARSEAHLWATELERDSTQLLQLPSDVARAVAAHLQVPAASVTGPPAGQPVGVNQSAQEEYLLGRYLLWKVTDDDRQRAIEHFQRAVSLAPDYAAPYAGLAHAWWMRGVFGDLSLRETAPAARDAARRALALDDKLAEAHAAAAWVQGMLDWDWTGAEATVQRAIAREPNNVDAHYVRALLLMATGRLSEALAAIEGAAQLDPLSAQVQSTFGRILYRARRFDEAIARLRRAIELEPRNATAYGRLGDVYTFTGRYDEALQMYDKAGALGGGASAGQGNRSRIARTYARMGREREARALLASLNGRSASAVHAALGERDRAFALLFAEVEHPGDGLLFIKADPDFESLYDDPRWTDLLARMHLG